MNLQQLKTFQIAARNESFLAAAEALQYSQPTITLHIQQLEAAWGVELFWRNGRRVTLTEAGRRLLSQVENVLGQLDILQQAAQDAAGGETGHIRLGCIEPAASQYLVPQISAFLNRRPNLHLTLETGGTDAISYRVAGGKLDAGICSPPVRVSGLTFEPLYTEEMALLVPDGHELAARQFITARDLEGERVLLTEPTCAYRQVIEKVLLENGLHPYSGIQVDGLEALRSMVQHSVGVAVYPASYGQALEPGMTIIPFADIRFELTVGLVLPQTTPPWSPTMLAFLPLLYGLKDRQEG